jgi:hypothetical protein
MDESQNNNKKRKRSTIWNIYDEIEYVKCNICSEKLTIYRQT